MSRLASFVAVYAASGYLLVLKTKEAYEYRRLGVMKIAQRARGAKAA